MIKANQRHNVTSKPQYLQQGFTLVELVMVIILLAIVGTFSSQFIATNVTLFQQSVNQNERLNDARFVINRIDRELNSAIAFSARVDPSVRVVGEKQCLYFIPFNDAGLYLGQASGAIEIQLVMDENSRNEQINIAKQRAQRLSIYNKIRKDEAFEDQMSEFNNAPLISKYEAASEVVSGASSTHSKLSLDPAIIGDSPAARYFIFNTEVSYCLLDNSLYRHEVSLTDPEISPLPVLMMDRLTPETQFKVIQASQFSNAIVELDMGFSLRDGQSIGFQHQAVMNNVP